MPGKKLHILLVADDRDEHHMVKGLLHQSCDAGVNVVWSKDYQHAIYTMENQNFDVLLFDYKVGAARGVELAKWATLKKISTPIILLAGVGDREVYREAIHCGATDYLVKEELNAQLLARSIRYAIRQKTDEKKLIKLAHYDPLTGLANRSFFQENLRLVVQHSKRSKEKFAVITIDLDHFKNINDTLGHEAGDELLVEVANILQGCCRETDTVARLGGDEFGIIATHLSNRNSATMLAKKIVEKFATPIKIRGQAVSIGLSMGISLCPLDANEHVELQRLSDIALFQAKSSGRNTFHFYDEEQNKKAHEQAVLQNEISQAIDEGHFKLYFQPIVEIKSGCPMYAEALMRWDHPEKGFIPPDKFIPVMELSSGIIAMGEWVIRQAAEQNIKWREQGLPSVSIAVNVSAKQFGSPTLVTTIQEVLQQYQLAPSCLIVELTESVLMPTEQVLSTLKELKATGIKISIDDFGTGYSSLAYLKRFDVNALKIDREFIKDFPYDDEDNAITSAIIALGSALNLEIVAEGIETIDQQQHLIAKRCDFAQGYLFARPMPPDEFVHWYKKRVKDLH